MTNLEWIRQMPEADLALFLCNMMTRECCEESCPARSLCSTGRNGLRQWVRMEADIPEEDGASETTPCQPYYSRQEELYALKRRMEQIIAEMEAEHERDLENRFVVRRRTYRDDLPGEHLRGC